MESTGFVSGWINHFYSASDKIIPSHDSGQPTMMMILIIIIRRIIIIVLILSIAILTDKSVVNSSTIS